MKNLKKLFKSDWFIGLALSLLLLVLNSSMPMQALERKAYDWGIQASHRDAGDKIAIIAIDDESIKNIGRWPWPRQVHAQLIDTLISAKTVGHTVFFLEPQQDQGLSYITKIDDYLKQSHLANSVDGIALNKIIDDAKLKLNADEQLANSLKNTHNVVMAMPFTLGAPQGNPDSPLPAYVANNALTQILNQASAAENDAYPPATLSVIPPLANVASHAQAIGHLNNIPDLDGAIRIEPLVLQYFDQYYPSLALQIAANYLNLSPKDIQVKLGEGVQLGKLKIETDSALQMNTFFYKHQFGKPAFAMDSFYDVLSGKIAADKYKGKIVLIGMAATGGGSDMQITPISANTPPIETLAHTVASILNEDFFITPKWASALKWLSWLIVSAYLILILPKLNASIATFVSVFIIFTLLLMHFIGMTQYGWWLKLMMPIALLILGHALLSTKRYLTTEADKNKSDAESTESNRNLALMLQSQGQLDMAFDRFRKCQLDDSLMEGLYNLGLDFERKRQFNKAESVFSYMASHNPRYKDVQQRIKTSKQMSETLILGLGAQSMNRGLLLNEDSALEKPMLGRYQIEKELGKGAMGTVYLGIDPKIGRQVAIKTLALSQEFDASELESVKSRFFREAETAGKLNHPNIVTIYDAGEEHDLAYIAMELLKGQDLNQSIKSNTLLPLSDVLKIMIKVAEALDFAHQQQVIHRDIKPANIMYEPETQSVKVTDFGIARITDSSKTKTGMVLGTPNFMSPEQLSGKKLDGRSDLFSLGTTMYQLTTGALPFEGDSMANLMYNISNQHHKDVLELNPKLPRKFSDIINRLLEKDVNKRYANGKLLANDLEDCLSEIAQ